MKKIVILVMFLTLLFTGCRNSIYNGIPEEYDKLLSKALDRAGDNRKELEKALKECANEQKEGMAFIIAYMPDRDLHELSADFLLENINLAYKARAAFEWAKEIPDSIFYNDVLPYASMNETRDNWRSDFFNRFSVYVKDAPDIFAAIDSVNKNIRDELKVDYNTKREKPDQSPYESMRQGMASCSGLSVLLTDAFRSVGIPSRIAGTPNWHDKRGNHNWNEVWANGEWYFTEYYPSQLNKSWFLADAGKANPEDQETSVYACSWKPTGIYFPLVWDLDIKYVNGLNVTHRYISLYEAERALDASKNNKVALTVVMNKNNRSEIQDDNRVDVNIDIFCGDEQIGGGRSSGIKSDLNDFLTFYVDKNNKYTLKYNNSKGFPESVDVVVESEDVSVKLFWED